MSKLFEKELNIYEIVKTLVGEVSPIGDSHEDEKIQENMKLYIEIFMAMFEDIQNVALYKNDTRSSMQKVGSLAYNNLVNYIYPEIEYVIEEVKMGL